MNKELMDQVEGLIDKHGIENFISACVQVCDEKAAHIRTNWQDTTLAKGWDMLATHFSHVGTVKGGK